MFRQVFLIILLGITISLCGCGQKGPLYLPSDNEQIL